MNTSVRYNTGQAKTLITIFWIVFGATILVTVLNVSTFIQNQGNLGTFGFDKTYRILIIIQSIFGLLYRGIIIASIIVFLLWFSRAYANLHRMGLKYLSFNWNWTVWGFVVPVISFYRPYQIMKEVWFETQDQIKKVDPNYEINKNTFVIGSWWFLFLVSAILGGAAWIMNINAIVRPLVTDLWRMGMHLSIAANLLNIVETLTVIFMVKKISQFERKLFSLLNTTDVSGFGESDEPDQNFEANAKVSLNPR